MVRKSVFWFIVIVSLFTTSIVLAQESSTEATQEQPVTTRSALPDASTFNLVEIITGLRNPLWVTHAGDGSGRIFVLEQSGRIWVVRDDTRLETPFMDLSDRVSQDVLTGYSERGLLGLAFHPNYAENGLFFVNYTDRNGTTRVVSFNVSADDPDRGDPNTARELLSIGQPFPNHNGGDIAFGPDGYLYISVGDGGSADDPQNHGQNPATLLGTILRIDVDDFTPNRPYGIPADNPYTRNPALAPEIWAWGLRNVWRFSFDRATDDMYIADVGQRRLEEVNFQPADSPGGENYGWRAFEGSRQHIGEPASEVVMPIAEYDHSLGCSVTGGYVYRGQNIPELQGAYLYSDYCSGRIWAAYRDENGEWHSGEIMNTQRQISSFGEDEAGELYLVDYRGRVLRFVPAG